MPAASPPTRSAAATPGPSSRIRVSAGAYEPYLPATDMPRFVRELAEFVGFDDSEAAVVRRTAPQVLAREATLTAALYEHFLKFPAAARFFLGPDGEPDRVRL